MIAPRGLFIMENPYIDWLAARSGSVAALGGAEVYTALGAQDNITYWSDIQNGSHCATRPEWTTPLQQNIQKFLLNTGNAAGTFRISSLKAGNLSQWRNWQTPTLSDGTTTPPPQVPGTPGNLTASNPTASSISLSWSASSGAVSQYLIERCQGANCNNFTQAATSTSTSYTSTGLSANTLYRFRVRASNSAGNSGYSNIAEATTTGGQTSTPPPGGGCSAGYRQVNQWPGGFQGEVMVTNTGTSNSTGWSVVLTFANGQRITQIWGGLTNLSGNSPYTVTNESWNGSLSPSGSAVFGFLGSWSGSNNAPTLSCTRTS